MKRWAVRLALGGGSTETITVRADSVEIEAGVLVFVREMPTKERRRTINGWVDVDTTALELVRAFGVGQWRDVEPLASPPPIDYVGASA